MSTVYKQINNCDSEILNRIDLNTISSLSRYEKLLNEMLSHLERQPRNKERRIAWLKHIDPLFNSVGLVLLAHFRRIFPLFFKWMHADDDETVLLVSHFLHKKIKIFFSAEEI